MPSLAWRIAVCASIISSNISAEERGKGGGDERDEEEYNEENIDERISALKIGKGEMGERRRRVSNLEGRKEEYENNQPVLYGASSHLSQY